MAQKNNNSSVFIGYSKKSVTSTQKQIPKQRRQGTIRRKIVQTIMIPIQKTIEQENDEDSGNNEESSNGNDGHTLLPFPYHNNSKTYGYVILFFLSFQAS